MHFIAILHDVEDDLAGWWHPRKKTSNFEQSQIPEKDDELRMRLILYHSNWKDKSADSLLTQNRQMKYLFTYSEIFHWLLQKLCSKYQLSKIEM